VFLDRAFHLRVSFCCRGVKKHGGLIGSKNMDNDCYHLIVMISIFSEKCAGGWKLSDDWKIWCFDFLTPVSHARFRHHCTVKTCTRVLLNAFERICPLTFLSLCMRLTSSTLFFPLTFQRKKEKK